MENRCYFEFPFINDRTHNAIKNIFKTAQLPVRVYSKNITLRSLLSRRRTPEKCTIRGCSIADARLCTTKMCVYEMSCQKCSNFYIGSTVRQLHTLVKEHLQMESSSVLRHRKQCNGEFDVAVLARDRNANRLRFKEAVLIQEKKPTLNNKLEREELLHLIFWHCAFFPSFSLRSCFIFSSVTTDKLRFYDVTHSFRDFLSIECYLSLALQTRVCPWIRLWTHRKFGSNILLRKQLLLLDFPVKYVAPRDLFGISISSVESAACERLRKRI